MNLAKDNVGWQRTLSVTPLPVEVRRRAALYVAAHATGGSQAERRDDVSSLLDKLGLLDQELRTR
ncbi:hypothetical protein RCO28_30765 [Streptomyces sp. LHD-70]|uniref:hypothetical protein n=1 Tax=Streptomyces sp. LHD-70 TaxID=3072140 RepID=UPI00280E6FF6|nr:hypothetical protein [Streptomyces sp. LHD-70]MDQ8706820.1 hypothetical protein [Streptomyces sp. LHD-70]